MIKIENYDCKIFTDNIEPGALQQVYDILKQSEWEGLRIRIMPDVHSAQNCVIGFVSEVGKYINPDYIGIDIGCMVSMALVDKPVDPKDYALFEHRLKQAIPMGQELQPARQFVIKDFLAYLRAELQKAYQNTHGLTYLPDFNSEEDLERWLRGIGMDISVFYKSIGSVGSGNHYIEYDEGMHSWNGFGPIASPAFTQFQGISVHTGSRNLGIKVNKYWATQAQGDKIPREVQKAIQAEVKSRPDLDRREIKPAIDAEMKKWREENIHPGLLSGENLRGYLTDMVIACSYAAWNHKIILDKAVSIYSKITGGKETRRITTRHNYIDFSGATPIIRKGAVSAKKDEILLVPFNMRDGVAVCRGKGNQDWLESCSHGSGRKMSRNAAKSSIGMKEFEESMKDVYSTTVCKETLDESPMAYKDTQEIIDLIKDTVDIECILKPKINIKATK